MKRRFWGVLLALVLVLSLSLVTAVPMATPAKAATTFNVAAYTLSAAPNAAAWSTTQKATGTHSVLLNYASGDNSYVEFTPLTGTTVDDLDNITATEWSFWYHFPTDTGYGPLLELRFTSGTGHIDITVNTAEATHTHDAPITEAVTTASTCIYFGNDSIDGTSFYNNTGSVTLAEVEASIDAQTAMTAHSLTSGAWALTRVRAEIGWDADARTCYIDDIEIAGTTYYGLFEDVIDVATTGDTINVAAGTYSAETTWPIDVDKALTIQGAAGKTSIIAPGAAGRGVIAITVDSVTIDGFTISGGSQAYTAGNPQEHAIWVAANYSTIKNNTILNYRGNQAGIYIGGRQSNVPTGAVFGYIPGTPENSRLGHTIQDNTFRQVDSGEGWGIFAYELSDSLIHGNIFLGDSDDSTNGWAADEGAPGTGIIIHKATADVGSPSPGGGYVIIEDNTARYVKYSWLTFYAAYMYTDSVGYGYEQPEDSEVDKVIVRNNTVQDVGTAIVFCGASKGSAYGVKYADLTVGSAKVTIGQGNTIYNNGDGIRIDAPKLRDGNYGSVVVADTIVIKYNDIYTNTLDTSSWWGSPDGYGVRNLTSALDSGPDNADAKYNYWGDPSGPTVATATTTPSAIAVNDRGTGDKLSPNVLYDPWLHTTQATVYPSGVRYYAYNWCDLTKGWNIWSTPIAPDSQADTWGEYKVLGVDLDLATGASAYYFNGSTQAWASVTDAYTLTPCDAIYVKVASTEEAPILFSSSTSVPSKTLYAGWNLVSASYINNMDSPTIGTAVAAETALNSVYYVSGANNIGYSQVVSPATGQTGWSAVRGPAINTDIGQDMLPCKGYWVYMTNAGTLAGTVFTPVSPLQ